MARSQSVLSPALVLRTQVMRAVQGEVLRRLLARGRRSSVVRSRAPRAVSLGPTAVAALAIGGAAVGALAVGAVAVGRLVIGKASIKELHIHTLIVDDLQMPSRGSADRSEPTTSAPTM